MGVGVACLHVPVLVCRRCDALLVKHGGQMPWLTMSAYARGPVRPASSSDRARRREPVRWTVGSGGGGVSAIAGAEASAAEAPAPGAGAPIAGLASARAVA